MNPIPSLRMQRIAVALFVSLLTSVAGATCGGGGGGGSGGFTMSEFRTSNDKEKAYEVPWQLMSNNPAIPAGGLRLYWFPMSTNEMSESRLRTSRELSLWSGQGITMLVAQFSKPIAKELGATPDVSQVILTDANGTVLARAEGRNTGVKIAPVRNMVKEELDRREASVNKQLKDAKGMAKAGDKAAAIELYQKVWAERLLFPKEAKQAARELKKLDVDVADDDTIAALPDRTPIHEGDLADQVINLMNHGLDAEIAGDYELARRYYSAARELDPADAAPSRYLGELYRHHTGEWDEARVVFEQMLTEQVDPLSRAVALHGLGKMTIHEGEFIKGLELMEQSVAVFPLPLAYRNIAVFWNSEAEHEKAAHYTALALKLAPKDPYNQVFAAVFLAANGQREEALRIAQENEWLMSASYNLAAIYAQTGDKERALEMLERHFYTYERYNEVRAKEMMEARVDAVFDSIRAEEAFVQLTHLADGRLPVPDLPRKPMTFPEGRQ
ncbi:tetratricopeptide repeat protein [Dokdonella sp.]|uniref:tetratricopeptide repeat protein n=1 Tax=Dokdonella sp. TaxID=2291710 RepID=UPI0035276B7A